MRSFKNGCRHWILALALAVSSSVALAGENPFQDFTGEKPAAGGPEEPYYGPDAYMAEDRLGEYIAQARSYLTRHPDSPRGAEIAADLLMAGMVLQDEDTQQWARTRLLFDHPQSFAARHAVASFADEKSCRTFLQTLTPSLKDDPSETNCRRLAQALELSLAAWGPTLISEDAFVLECALISYCVQNARLHQLCRAQLARCSEETREIAAMAFESESTHETIRKLHEIKDNQSARLYEQFFYTRLSSDERQEPEMLRLASETHLRNEEFEKALPLIEEALASEQDPQLLCWLGTCLAVAGRADEACEVLGRLQRDFPESPWAEQAREMGRLIERQDDSFARQAAEAFAALSRMRADGLDLLESRFEFRWKGDALIGGYVGVLFPENRFEAVLSRDGKMLIAYRTTDRDCRVYFDGEPAIVEFAQAGALPVPSARLERTDEGGYRFDFGGGGPLMPAAPGLSRAGDSLLDSPVLSSRESIAQWLRYTFVRSGYFAEPVEQSEGDAVLRWSKPAISSPTFHQWECRISRDEPRVSVSAADGMLSLDVRHGPIGSFELSPPEWPAVPITRREKMDPTAIFRLLSAVVQLVSEDEPK